MVGFLMRALLLFTFIICALSTRGYSYENEPFLRVHGMIGTTGLPSKYEDDKTYFLEYGAGTKIGYIFSDWEFGLFSSYHTGDPGQLEFSKDETGVGVTGTGNITSVTYGPYFKYYVPYTIKGWRPYAGLGPIFSLKSVRLDNYTVEDASVYDHNHRINFTTMGAELKLGAMEADLCKEEYPAYIELALGYERVRRTTVVDASNYARVQKVQTSDVYGEQVHVFYGFINVGITVF